MNKWFIFVVLAVAVIIGLFVPKLISDLSLKSRVELAHDQNIDALHVYYQGSMEGASNALTMSIKSLEESRTDAKGKYYFDVMIFVSRIKLANIYLMSSNEAAACHELLLAYPEHVAVQRRSGKSPVSPDDFVIYAFEGLAEVDRQTGVSWMNGRKVSNDSLVGLSRQFRLKMDDASIDKSK